MLPPLELLKTIHYCPLKVMEGGEISKPQCFKGCSPIFSLKDTNKKAELTKGLYPLEARLSVTLLVRIFS